MRFDKDGIIIPDDGAMEHTESYVVKPSIQAITTIEDDLLIGFVYRDYEY